MNPYEKFIEKLAKKHRERSAADYTDTEPNPDYMLPEDDNK